MIYFIDILLFAIIGGVLAFANITFSDWHFWVILLCAIGSHVCGYIKGMKASI